MEKTQNPFKSQFPLTLVFVFTSISGGITVISENGNTIGEINRAGEKVVIGKGGIGGCAANGFAAEKGQAHIVTLDLKLIADVGFLGFPNAGKSTLLQALSKARPKIASYPFTTINPNIGIVEFNDFRRISLADLPGLIEGAHANQGMGHKFLKHVERTKLLLFVVDLHGFQISPQHPHRSALETIVLLNKELELYQADLTEKSAILALNKMDLPNSYPIIQNVRKTLTDDKLYSAYINTLPPEFRPSFPMKFEHILSISAQKDQIATTNLKNIIRSQLDIDAQYAELQESNLNDSILVKS
ncbi:GTP-binding protein 10 homolog isoform X2 [Folsomia candida]|uniref:GTP-binding protein 10 homolog isoform X2 n=1 Tax=Folsomia candida TaxID=158441 RepID=UPI001604FE56|nr:GTP-binding protein 10 homolog isoform X2 [Folsomia candida]